MKRIRRKKIKKASGYAEALNVMRKEFI